MVTPNPLLDLRSHVGIVASKVRFDVLDRTLAPIGEVTPARGTSITNDTRATIFRTLRGFTLTANDARALNMETDRIQPVWCLEDGTEWPMGVFMLGDEDRAVGSNHTLVDATLMDQSYQVSRAMSRSFGLGSGALVHPAMVELVEEAGIFVYDIEDTQQTVGDAINFPVGTSRARILNALATLAGYLPVHFDNPGTLRIRTSTPAVGGAGHVYDTEGPEVRIVRGSIKQRRNKAPNVYVVVCNGPTASEIVARAYVDPRAAHSVENRGYEDPKILRMQGLVDTEHAQRIADLAAAQDPAQLETVTFIGPPDPRHDTFDPVEFGLGFYRETSWSVALDPGADHAHAITKQIDSFEGTDGT